MFWGGARRTEHHCGACTCLMRWPCCGSCSCAAEASRCTSAAVSSSQLWTCMAQSSAASWTAEPRQLPLKPHSSFVPFSCLVQVPRKEKIGLRYVPTSMPTDSNCTMTTGFYLLLSKILTCYYRKRKSILVLFPRVLKHFSAEDVLEKLMLELSGGDLEGVDLEPGMDVDELL